MLECGYIGCKPRPIPVSLIYRVLLKCTALNTESCCLILHIAVFIIMASASIRGSSSKRGSVSGQKTGCNNRSKGTFTAPDLTPDDGTSSSCTTRGRGQSRGRGTSRGHPSSGRGGQTPVHISGTLYLSTLPTDHKSNEKSSYSTGNRGGGAHRGVSRGRGRGGNTHGSTQGSTSGDNDHRSVKSSDQSRGRDGSSRGGHHGVKHKGDTQKEVRIVKKTVVTTEYVTKVVKK